MYLYLVFTFPFGAVKPFCEAAIRAQFSPNRSIIYVDGNTRQKMNPSVRASRIFDDIYDRVERLRDDELQLSEYPRQEKHANL